MYVFTKKQTRRKSKKLCHINNIYTMTFENFLFINRIVLIKLIERITSHKQILFEFVGEIVIWCICTS